MSKLEDTFDPILNRELVDTLVQHENGKMDKIAAASTDYIRTHIREEGFLRKILPPEMVGNEDLDRVAEHDRPMMIVELQPGHKGAISVPFNVSSDTEFFYGPRGVIEFFEVKSPVFTKNVNELRTYRMDIRKVITEQSLNDIETKEDGLFISCIDSIVGSDPAAVGKGGVQQFFKAGDGVETPGTLPSLTGGITRSSYIEVKKFLEKNRLNNGTFLMNRSTAKEFEKQDRYEVGGDLSEKMWKEGLKGIGDAVIGGVPHIYTIKDELVPDNVIYCFTTPNYLGKFCILQDVTMFAEKKQNIITMQAQETIGLGLLNAAGVVKVDFNNDDTP